MTTNFGQVHEGEGNGLGHLLWVNGDGIQSGGWEELFGDPIVDRRSAEHSLSILACREYEENGPSQA